LRPGAGTDDRGWGWAVVAGLAGVFGTWLLPLPLDAKTHASLAIGCGPLAFAGVGRWLEHRRERARGLSYQRDGLTLHEAPKPLLGHRIPDPRPPPPRDASE
jgi:hypothetical protein